MPGFSLHIGTGEEPLHAKAAGLILLFRSVRLDGQDEFENASYSMT